MDLDDAVRTDIDDLGFSGVVMVEIDGSTVVSRAAGLADRERGVPMTPSTAVGTASVTKAFTALTMAALLESSQATGRETLGWSTTVADLTDDMPMVDRRVTIEQLLGHTSGVGDYLDEEKLGHIDDEIMTVPVETLLDAADYLPMLTPYPQRDTPGTTFRYNNSGYVILALLIERIGGRSYHDLVERCVLGPAGMTRSGFFLTAEPPDHAAHGYMTDGRLNTSVLPARGVGDGGLFATAPDLLGFWAALGSGRIVSDSVVSRMTTATARSDGRYGLGFWLDPELGLVCLEGIDAGVSCRTGRLGALNATYAILSNTSDGVWPIARRVEAYLGART